jgi:hypothetical protein
MHVPYDRGEVGGIFAAVTDETSRVIGERRLRLLREVATASSQAHAPEQVCAIAAKCISPNARDLPFVLLYLTEPGGETVRLAAQVGREPGSAGAASCVELNNAASQWPLAQATSDNALSVVENLSSRFAQLPTGAWDRAPDCAAVVPLGVQGQAGVPLRCRRGGELSCHT